MHFDVVLSEFINSCSKKRRRAQFSIRAELTRLSVCMCFRCVCVCAASDVCAENFSNIAQLFRQQSRASYMLALCLRAGLISSPDMWDWTRMHALVVMHRQDIIWKCGQCQNKGAFLYYRYLYFTRGIDASYRHTLYRYIDPYRWIVTPLAVAVGQDGG